MKHSDESWPGLWGAPATQVDLTFVMQQPDENASAYAHSAGWRLAQVAAASLAAGAVRRTQSSRQPRPVAVGDYPVVLELYAAVSLLQALAGIRGVGGERRTVAGYFGDVHHGPALAPDHFRFVAP